jgi:cytochrome oxidase Cu insertion factor (SCO1/SenC/PrrC family)
LLEVQGFADQIHTAAITYDPAFDLPKRMRIYGQDRGVRLDVHHRMLRATEGINALRSHFKLGVNWILVPLTQMIAFNGYNFLGVKNVPFAFAQENNSLNPHAAMRLSVKAACEWRSALFRVLALSSDRQR